jgi:AraC family transcriptional regulator of arabinose operon
MLKDNLKLTSLNLGSIVYPPRSTLGPRIQPSLQFVILYAGAMTVWIDHLPYEVPLRSITVLFPEHHEYFVFAQTTTTHHSWVHLFFEEYPEQLMTRLQMSLVHSLSVRRWMI